MLSRSLVALLWNLLRPGRCGKGRFRSVYRDKGTIIWWYQCFYSARRLAQHFILLPMGRPLHKLCHTCVSFIVLCAHFFMPDSVKTKGSTKKIDYRLRSKPFWLWRRSTKRRQNGKRKHMSVMCSLQKLVCRRKRLVAFEEWEVPKDRMLKNAHCAKLGWFCQLSGRSLYRNQYPSWNVFGYSDRSHLPHWVYHKIG